MVSQFLGGVNQSAIENYTGEPDGHSGQWTGIEGRYYIDTGGTYSGFSYNALNETARLQALMHHVGDVSVPAHHYPANIEYDSQWAEGLCEAAATGGYLSVGELPNVANTTSYTHTRNGHSYNFTGTIDQVTTTFFNACRDNAAWYKSTKKTFLGIPYHTASDIASANWNGLKIDLMLQRAVFVDYFLAKLNPVMEPYKFPTGSAGGNISFNYSDAYDPDCVTWESNGSYSQIHGVHSQGLQYYLYDFDGDVPSGGDWEYQSYNDITNFSVNDLIAMGLPTNQWTVFYVAACDNEGKWYSVEDYMYLSTGGVPEPATLSLLAVGGLALLRKKQ
ncbi:MAG: PEP-CTERM sorting domain-containing protein [Phycisphaerae bacterium]|nr:PEP-CTERM sorting domain-containing protein [Phycisphaerae bacterium]